MAHGERILIWGGGGHGKVVADVARALGLEVVGFVDVDAKKLGVVVEPGGGKVVRLEEDLLREVGGTVQLPEGVDSFALAIGDNAARWRSHRVLNGLEVRTLSHPSAILSASVVIGRGTVVFPRAVINAASRVGEAAIINTGAIVEHDCVIGDGAHISPGAVLAGGVRVGELSWVGAGAIVLPGVEIGREAVVGAGAVVRKDVGDGTTVAGVPARPIRKGA